MTLSMPFTVLLTVDNDDTGLWGLKEDGCTMYYGLKAPAGAPIGSSKWRLQATEATSRENPLMPVILRLFTMIVS